MRLVVAAIVICTGRQHRRSGLHVNPSVLQIIRLMRLPFPVSSNVLNKYINNRNIKQHSNFTLNNSNSAKLISNTSNINNNNNNLNQPDKSNAPNNNLSSIKPR